MSKRWEIHKVSTPEQRIFKKISEEMAQPVGIVLLGTDCKLKDKVYNDCVKQIPNLVTGYSGEKAHMDAASVVGIYGLDYLITVEEQEGI